MALWMDKPVGLFARAITRSNCLGSFERWWEAGSGSAADLRRSAVPSLRKKPRVFLLRSALVFYAAEPDPASRHLGLC